MDFNQKYENAMQYRPENIRKLFPQSKAMIVSGKVVHAAMLKKREAGQRAMTIAANARNPWVLEGALKAAAKTGSAIIVEIAKSESTYCPINFFNLAEKVHEICEKNDLKVVVAVHADHYAIKKQEDIPKAKEDFPKMIEKGVTSIAIDASHLPPHDNINANLELSALLPEWLSIETEVGEIKGKDGLSTVEEALFHVQALNSHGVFPTWIALNNGSVHGIEATGGGIQVELTGEIHDAIQKYGVYGAQHGTSGNNYDKLKAIVNKTNTTKANVATALQMIGWGLKVNEYGNAETDGDKNFIKQDGKGLPTETWKKMTEVAAEKGWTGGNYKKLNLEVHDMLEKLPQDVQADMVNLVEEFVVKLLTNVFYTEGTAEMALDIMNEAKSENIKLFDRVIEDKSKWTPEYIEKEGKALLEKQQHVEGDFDD